MELHYIEVRAGDCPCPGTPHQVERIGLLPTVPMTMGVAALKTIQATAADIPEMTAALTAVYFRHGIADWSFVDATGQAIAINAETVAEFLPWDKGGYEVADAADSLYSETVMRPLVKLTSASSGGGPTGKSTSPSRRSGSKPPARSARSSQNGTAGQPSGAPAL